MTNEDFVAALRSALRDFNRPDLLARSPLLRARILADKPAAGAAELKALLTETVGTLFASARDEKIRRSLELTYFQSAPKQEVVADRLGLSFGTYRRHLTAGHKRLADWLWQQETTAIAEEPPASPPPSPPENDAADDFFAGLPTLPAGEADGATAEPSPTAPFGARRLSIVVLPFANLGNAEDEYFADGITESLTTDLSRIPDAFVIARATAFTFKGKAVDVRQLGRELGVRYVLEGSIQGGADRVRFNAQLLDAESGAHIWAERFDKPRADMFDMQDEVTSRLARMVGVKLVAAESRRAEQGTGHGDSIDLTMRGRAVLNEDVSVEAAHQARRFFAEALRLDENNVAALLGLADAHVWEVTMYLADDRARQARIAELAVQKALSLAPNSALVRCCHGTVLWAKGQPDRALREFELAISIDRNLAAAHAYSGLMKFYLGRFAETEGHVAEAQRLSPRDPLLFLWCYFLGSADLGLGRTVRAMNMLRHSVELNAQWPFSHFVLASALAHAGLLAEAAEAADAGLRLAPHFTIARLRTQVIGTNPIYLAQRERLYVGLKLAGVPVE